LEVFDEFRVSIMKKKIVMNERLPRDNTEQVDQPLGGFTDVSRNDVAPGGGVENGEVDIGVDVGRVEEAKKANRVLGSPWLEDSVDVEEVVEEGTVPVPALAGANRA
ncbi:hypothetical protein PanWU01x14_097120, partial [Parasponia andersonii]